jgi:hypothetical protein
VFGVKLQLFRNELRAIFDSKKFGAVAVAHRQAELFAAELTAAIGGLELPWRRDVLGLIGKAGRKKPNKLPVGVTEDLFGKPPSIVAYWTTPDGRSKRMKFGIRKYGRRRAIGLAKEARAVGVALLVRELEAANHKVLAVFQEVCRRFEGDFRQARIASECRT